MITGFEHIREDGKVITESMTIDRIIAEWPICRVIDVQWQWQGKRLNVAHPLGLLAVLVPGRQHLAVLMNTDDSCQDASLHVISGDGQRSVLISDRLLIRDTVEAGTYVWFEYRKHDRSGVFTCVFSRARDQSMYNVDIDAATGGILAVAATR